MTNPVSPTHDVQCTIALAAAEVDAGADVAVTVSCACGEGCDLTDHTISIRDAAGTEIAATALAAGEEAYVAEITFRAPLTAGEHTFSAVLVPADAHEIAQDFTVTTRAHASFVNVWGLPPAVGAGERFAFKVGVKCSAACSQGGRTVEITTSDGTPVATAVLGNELWPGTAALHYAEIDIPAPNEPGRTDYLVGLAATPGEPPHAEGTARFSLNVVPAGDHEITVTVLDGEARAPIANAQIVLHPYRSQTDASGIARLRVARGSYRLQVSGKKYLPSLCDVTVAESMAISAELAREPPPRSPDEGY